MKLLHCTVRKLRQPVMYSQQADANEDLKNNYNDQ